MSLRFEQLVCSFFFSNARCSARVTQRPHADLLLQKDGVLQHSGIFTALRLRIHGQSLHDNLCATDQAGCNLRLSCSFATLVESQDSLTEMRSKSCGADVLRLLCDLGLDFDHLRPPLATLRTGSASAPLRCSLVYPVFLFFCDSLKLLVELRGLTVLTGFRSCALPPLTARWY